MANHTAHRGVSRAWPLAEKRRLLPSARPPAEVAFVRARPGTLRCRTGSHRNMHARNWAREFLLIITLRVREAAREATDGTSRWSGPGWSPQWQQMIPYMLV